MIASRRRLVLLAAVLLPACNSESPNPFTDPGRAAPPLPTDQIVFTSNRYDEAPGLPRDVFSSDPDGASLTRLTYCNQSGSACDTIEAVPSSDRQRMAFRRIFRDTNGDGTLSTADAAELVVADLEAGVQAPVIRELWDVNGVDWFGDTLLLFSATATGQQTEDLFVMDFNGANRSALTTDATGGLTTGIRERRPRIANSGQALVYERIEADGKGTLWVYPTATQITFGGPGSEPLPGTPYVVGSDADPSFSPDNSAIVFRRLTALGDDGWGRWSIMTVATRESVDGIREVREVLPGDRYRGAPDWGPEGILFEERAEDGSTELVVIQPDGSGRLVLATADSLHAVTNPYWLP
jgi:Tol biopolymer transport system component